MAEGGVRWLLAAMKHHLLSQHQNQSRVVPGPIIQAAAPDHAAVSEEIARKAYFSYVDQGSRPGNDVRDWLQAEAGLRAEQLNRV